MILADIAVLIFIALLAITIISARVAFALSKDYKKSSDRWFKVALEAGAICLFVALMLILTSSSGDLE